MEQFDTDLKLIIKAPNQNIEDQVINCSWNWSIKKLKVYLSEVYPNQPAAVDQKLIYSGRLLHDHLLLKDILRHENKLSSVHTLHLVCNRQNDNMVPSQNQQDDSLPSDTTDSDSDSDVGVRQRRQQTAQVQSENTTSSVSLQPEQPVPYMLPYATSPEVLAQMQAMQQMYASYFAQYVQNFQPNLPSSSVPSGGVPVTEVIQTPPVIPNNNNLIVPPAAPVIRPAVPENRNLRMNAQGGPLLDDNDDMGNRDWLDYFYLCCRGFVLFSIVYFYSSPERLMLVIILALLAFFYQEGWLLARGQNNRAAENRQNRLQQRNVRGHDTEDVFAHNQNREPAARVQENEIETAMDGDEPPHIQNQNIAENERSFPTWTFISSFFSSLIPEQPPPVNLN